MKLICKVTGVEVEATEEIAKRLIETKCYEVPQPKTPKRTPRKTKE